jgi:predicted CXXCH cytochrome family protein
MTREQEGKSVPNTTNRALNGVLTELQALVCLAALLGGGFVTAAPAQAKMSVLDTPHNLSASGGRGGSTGIPGISFAEERRVCVFCHVPHNALQGGPLWSRSLSPEATDYKPYVSTTQNVKPGKPTGASRLCLSCHDGTIALGQYVGSPIKTDVRIPTGNVLGASPNLTTDLRDDHPISFDYTEALATKSQLASPSTLPSQVRLEGGVTLQCTSCHDPHDNQYSYFLVMNNSWPNKPDYVAGSPLCVSCHKNAGWSGSTHNAVNTPSLATGCMLCHSVHNAALPSRLLRYARDEDNCLASCHNGNDTTSPNMKPLFGPSMSRHPVDSAKGNGIHDEAEDLPALKYHVQCVDCHNPHQANKNNVPLSAPPAINGPLLGVRKDILGNYATTEFDICFKCHAGDNADTFHSVTIPQRVVLDPNLMNCFDSRSPSFHPVTADRRGTTNGASLLAQYKVTMTRIYCSDCHNSDLSAKALGGGTGPNGPHGSNFPHILIAQYDMPLNGVTGTGQYPLCFRCHSDDYVMVDPVIATVPGTATAFNNLGKNEHAFHVRDKNIPCSACHDPHGVSWKMLATSANNAHLINFDKDYAVGAAVATPLYLTDSPGSGSCTVNCHTVVGNTHAYTALNAGIPKRIIRKLRPLK